MKAMEVDFIFVKKIQKSILAVLTKITIINNNKTHNKLKNTNNFNQR